MQRTGTESRPAGIRQNAEASPLLKLARRVREEQGVEQLKAFLTAMIPFAAPNEIRRVSEGFGIPFERISERRGTADNREGRQDCFSRLQQDGGNRQGSGVNPGLNMIRTLMQLRGAMNGAPDPKLLMELMGRNPR